MINIVIKVKLKMKGGLLGRCACYWVCVAYTMLNPMCFQIMSNMALNRSAVTVRFYFSAFRAAPG
jgi:hypothetical protein